MTVHWALAPQDPGQGSRHFSFLHARLLGHSESFIHSGRQFGGRPIKFGRQEHAGWVSITLHCELGPQGEGMQGLPRSVVGEGTRKSKISIEKKHKTVKSNTFESRAFRKSISCISG